MNMDMKSGTLALVGICALVLVIGVLRRKAEIILNFIVRSILGTIAIYTTNLLLAGMGVEVAAGLNLLNILTVGSLGTGGFALVYGILFYRFM